MLDCQDCFSPERAVKNASRPFRRSSIWLGDIAGVDGACHCLRRAVSFSFRFVSFGNCEGGEKRATVVAVPTLFVEKLARIARYRTRGYSAESAVGALG